MNAGYTKLFGALVASSIWDEDDKTRILWITMLALKNKNHVVEGTENWLALTARMSLEECRASLVKLESPDRLSRSSSHEGRRIERVEGGWLILNGEYYQKVLSREETRIYNASKQREYRARLKTVKRHGEIAGATEAVRDGLSSVPPVLEKGAGV